MTRRRSPTTRRRRPSTPSPCTSPTSSGYADQGELGPPRLGADGLGGSAAPMDLAEGGKTSVQLATLPDDGPTGGYFHLGEPLPW